MLYMMDNEELLMELTNEIIGSIFGDPGCSKERCVEIKNEIQMRMESQERFV